jgi:hypothetical protein
LAEVAELPNIQIIILQQAVVVVAVVLQDLHLHLLD